MPFDFKTDYEDLPELYRLESCQELKKKSYDVFYSSENQQCLAGFNIDRLKDKVQRIQSGDRGDEYDWAVEQYLTMAKCKGGKNFILEDIRANPLIYKYYSSAYWHCRDTGLFDSEKAINLKKYYRLYSDTPNHLEEIGSFFLTETDKEYAQKQFEGKKRFLYN